jgi:hypothetical protein
MHVAAAAGIAQMLTSEVSSAAQSTLAARCRAIEGDDGQRFG